MLKGLIIGLALTILAGQLPRLFGVEGAGGDFFEKLWGLLADLGDTTWLTPREAEVLALIAKGWPTPRSPAGWWSARPRSRATSTTCSPRSGARDRAQAVADAYRHHLVP